MNLLLRLSILLFYLWIRRYATDENTPYHSSQEYRVWLHDTGISDHLPNHRFFSFMELGRAEIFYRLLPKKRQLFNTLIAGQQLFYIRPIPLMARFELRTRLCFWDDKYCYFHQDFVQAGEVVASGLVKLVLVENRRVIAPEVLLGPPPENQDWQQPFDTWKTAQSALRAVL